MCIRDSLSSLNGSFLNKHRISSPEHLQNGDELLIGKSLVSVNLLSSDFKTAAEDSIQTQAAAMKEATATVLLADVRNYTRMSEQLPIEDVSKSLQLWLSGVSGIIKTYGGTVDKYIGDCVMSFFAGEAEEASALAKRALQCGQEILKYTREFSSSESWPHRDNSNWRCGVSINSGEAMLGGLGGKERRDFTILGDTVNSAFRLEALVSKYEVEIIVGAKTKEFLEDEFSFVCLGTEQLEGKEFELTVFTLI